MISKKVKLIAVVIVSLIIFIAVTFSKNWGAATTTKKIDDYTPIVKALKDNAIKARSSCPKIIKNLEKGIPELQKNEEKAKELKAYKLIADCQFAAQQYIPASDAYKKLAVAEPQVGRWHGLIAESLFNAGKAGEALPISILATQLAPKDFKLRRLNARILATLKLKNRTITAYRQAIEIAPYDELEKTQAELDQFVIDSRYLGQ